MDRDIIKKLAAYNDMGEHYRDNKSGKTSDALKKIYGYMKEHAGNALELAKSHPGYSALAAALAAGGVGVGGEAAYRHYVPKKSKKHSSMFDEGLVNEIVNTILKRASDEEIENDEISDEEMADYILNNGDETSEEKLASAIREYLDSAD